MTKNCERDYEGSKQCLEDSLRRLRTDHIDLWQFHEIIYDNDPDWVFEKGGIKAALEARKAGKVRFIGFTGHKDPRIHLKMLDKPFDWETVQMPINVMDAHYRSFQKQVVPVCLKKNVGVIGMKGLGGGPGIAAKGRAVGGRGVPLRAQPAGGVAGRRHDVDGAAARELALARDFTPMTPAEQTALAARVRDVAERRPVRAVQVVADVRRPGPSPTARVRDVGPCGPAAVATPARGRHPRAWSILSWPIRSFHGHGSGCAAAINAAPRSAMFFVKLTISLMRACPSSSRQNACIFGDTPRRNVDTSPAPTFGQAPVRMLRPPARMRRPNPVTARSGAVTPLLRAYPASICRLIKWLTPL